MTKELTKSKLTKKSKLMHELIEKNKLYNMSDAIKLCKKLAEVSNFKFDQTVEAVFKTCLQPQHQDQNLRVVVKLPEGTGKNVRVAVIAKLEKHDEAKTAGADLVGAEDLINAIKSGNINFDICIATPDMMGLIGSVAKILGPKGLMPNPKLGSVTLNIDEAVRSAKSGQVEIRVEKAGIIHAPFGKTSFSCNSLESNLSAISQSIIKAKPTGAKGSYIKAAYISPTMGPSIKIDVSSIYSNVKE